MHPVCVPHVTEASTMHQQRSDLLDDLHRGRRDVARPRKDVDTIAASAGAISTVQEEQVGEAAAVGVRTSHVHAPEGRSHAGDDLVRNRLCQGVHHHRRQEVANQGACPSRSGRQRIQDRTGRSGDGQRSQRTIIVRYVWAKNCFDAIRGIGGCVRQADVDGLLDLWIGTCKIDRDLVALHGQRHLEPNRRIDAIADCLGVIRTVRHGRDRLAHGRFAAAAQFFRQPFERIQVVLSQQLRGLTLNQRKTSELRVEVTHDLVRHANVLTEDALQCRIHLASAQHLHDGDLQAFLEHRGGVGRAHTSTDVRCVGDRTGPRHQLALEEDWLTDGDIGKVAGAEPDIVGHQDVALAERFLGECFEERADGPGGRADKRRDAVRSLRNRVALGVGDHACKVVGLANDGRERGTYERSRCLVYHRNEPPPEQLQGDSVKHDFLLRLDVCCLNYFLPLDRLGGHVPSCVFGRATNDLERQAFPRLLEIRLAQNLVDVLVVLGNYLLGYTGGSCHRKPAETLKSWNCRFGDGRQIGKQREAVLAGHCKAADLAGGYERRRGRQQFEHHVDLPTHEVVHGLGAALVGHVGELDARRLLEELAHHMRRRSRARGAKGQLARICLGVGDQLLEVVKWPARIDRHHARNAAQNHDGLNVFIRVVLQLRIDRMGRMDADRAQQQRAAVRLRLRNRSGSQVPAHAWLVFHHERPVVLAAETLADGSRQNIRGAARNEWSDKSDGTFGDGIASRREVDWRQACKEEKSAYCAALDLKHDLPLAVGVARISLWSIEYLIQC
ncbi:hypothetical protein CBM2598_U10275 [Cupriavidus taiwanensis]|uniref:Uncharacterized protein n=1 Tax=Cupriavidus taiwanensis TaxID=164546 RepID=A0A7Z7NR00_9BURK|nr:hypothetical protein CBM2597_U10073 [Cupriavidus taiwanensis]SOZ96477.1 hypothetical protein CBM2598_U10275 [Cupriavidus taiwanensis]SPC25579.1 hypothetical protein CBM2594_U10080 [Cupriavidus taiwanensis]